MSLPLKAKVTIRDLWTKDDAPARKALQALRDILGRDVLCEPQWQLLHGVLLSAYPDGSAAVISAVSSFVQAWCLGISELLEDGDDGEAWGEELLEAMKVSSGGALKLMLESTDCCTLPAKTTHSSVPSTSWDTSRGAFVLQLPANNPPDEPLAFVPSFRSQAHAAFTDAISSTATADRDGWADVVVSSANPPLEPEGASNYLPSAISLPQPDKLLLRPPYHLLVFSRGGSEIEIQSSHSPSLDLLAAYLKKWCRTNVRRSDRPPLVSITLHQSPFGLTPNHDALTLSLSDSRGDRSSLSLPLVFQLVENVLGYQQVHVDAACWQYRRDAPLKEL
ncbi:hypothetical protein TOPH_01695 [Tolypocladium ophioglossoides CBS 100239]|uniref:Uncharacterized protein n=1 Tax=Tolypocladium ophioglossoides (strain CBS 100239) TaxID=1163406 RepID=A0A0L0NIC8_TOLOC|nr:hypothetical protein TOPH_01695 [Tolypocladium ophioglossoides CBS 100239]